MVLKPEGYVETDLPPGFEDFYLLKVVKPWNSAIRMVDIDAPIECEEISDDYRWLGRCWEACNQDLRLENQQLQQYREILVWWMRQGWHPEDSQRIVTKRRIENILATCYGQMWKDTAQKIAAEDSA